MNPPDTRRSSEEKRTSGNKTDKKPNRSPGGKRPRRGAGGGSKKRESDKVIHGLVARQFAGMLVEAVLRHKRAFDEGLSNAATVAKFAELTPRDRAFARLIAATVLRHERSLTTVLDKFLQKPLKVSESPLAPVLLVGATQILILKTPAHAAIHLAVEQCKARRATQRFEKLVNAVLRRVSEQGAEVYSELDHVRLAMPDWLWTRWVKTYGEDETRAMVSAALAVPPIDISVKSEPKLWAERLGGQVLQTGTVRIEGGGRIEEMAGYEDGEWWVQDAAAALPVRLVADVKGKDVLDMCAAPGGKTAALVAAGAHVTALDQSEIRLDRLRENLKRLKMSAMCVTGDAAECVPPDEQKFDVILVDAPCTATGTIRRHPDIPHLKRPSDVKKLAQLQAKILDNAVTLIRPGGVLVYCTCSLEPEEGELQIERFLAEHPMFSREPISSQSDPIIDAEWVTPDGDLRTLPSHLRVEKPELCGLDGFFASRLRHHAEV
ncbi:MAG: 16S rRNA (cytosine(967)-C(5))-methyltransferase RsmB [Hyphomicrobiaceae bacterium]